MKEYQAEVLVNVRHELGEGPYYDARFDRLSWVDIIGHKLHTMKDGVISTFDAGEPIGAAIPLARSDGFLLAAKKGLYVLENGVTTMVQDMRDAYAPFMRFNDAKADPAGRLFAGTSVDNDSDEPAQGNLFLWQNGCMTVLQPDTKISNGMAWSKDRQTFWFSDSVEHTIFTYRYDLQTGLISNRKPLFRIDDASPDGLCVDADDNLWVAVWGGSRIEKRHGYTGELLEIVRVPALQTSSCCFCGKDLDTLLITSAATGLGGDTEGCIFTCKVDAHGLLPDLVQL